MNAASIRLKNLRYSYKIVSNTLRNMSSDMEGAKTKRKSGNDTLLENHLVSKEPIGQFKAWLEEACCRSDIILPNAMCLATATRYGVPSARIVVCKGYDKNGFKFFTDLDSRKSKEMLTNPNVAATFYWPKLNRCVRIEGYVQKLSDEESTNNFYSQPLVCQVAAVVSNQSTPIESRDVLCERESALEQTYLMPVRKIPKPTYWGGFIIRPNAVEFYQGQPNHLHDRIKFRKSSEFDVPDGKMLHHGEDGWVYERLSP